MNNQDEVKGIEFTPKWKTEYKYGSIFQVVTAKNEWSDKYPLLEKIVDGIISEEVATLLAKKREEIEKMFDGDERDEYSRGYAGCKNDILSILS